MATASVPEKQTSSDLSTSTNAMKVALPYILAIGAQIPMLLLFCRSLWSKTHYQTFVFAIIATAVIAWVRWPREERMPFHRSLASDVLLVIGLLMGLGSFLFVEPWFTAASVMFLLTSFFCRTVDPETKKSLWTAALPLFVFLPLPFRTDTWLITTLQQLSAWFTSRLLDLFGLGHHLSGTVIEVPGKEGYGVEEACSGVQSFFTLLFVCVIFLVLNRRITSGTVSGVLLTLLAILVFAAGLAFPTLGLAYVAIAIFLWALFGFRAAALIVSAVFWALVINTLRILLIPVLDINFNINLSHGLAHDLLGWGVLAIGVLLLLSTDQLLLFLFGPVDVEAGESGPFGKLITRFWNKLISGDQSDDGEVKKKRKGRRPLSASAVSFTWVVAIVMLLGGLYQLSDVGRAFFTSKKINFFDTDVTRPFAEEDLPKAIDDWTLVDNGYHVYQRDGGSDLGRHSDVWQYRSPRCSAITSLDQPFPGWHELTTCYQNQGWKLIDRFKIQPTKSGQEDWAYIEATFQRNTGERGYLLFSLFDGAGEPLDAPVIAGGLQSILKRAANRLSNRIRRSLFTAESYQTQVFLRGHFSPLDDSIKAEVADRYLTIRETMRTEFMAKEGIQPNTDAGTASLPPGNSQSGNTESVDVASAN